MDEHRRLVEFIEAREDWLIERILVYAQGNGFSAYTSTLVSAWRKSFQGLAASFAAAATMDAAEIALRADDSYAEDPATSFGRSEARLHRERGVSLPMFLGLFKYYRRCYHDLVEEVEELRTRARIHHEFLDTVLDRIEISFNAEWSGLGADRAVAELQRRNREMTNEKNRYLTVFESQAHPVFLLTPEGRVENMNASAAALFAHPGGIYYAGRSQVPAALEWLVAKTSGFRTGNDGAAAFEQTLNTAEGERIFEVRLSRQLDVTGRLTGVVANLSDITTHRHAVETISRQADALTRANEELQLQIASRERAEQELRLAQKLESIGQLAAGIAHEINTPAQYVADNLRFIDDTARGIFAALEPFLTASAETAPDGPEPDDGRSAEELLRAARELRSRLQTLDLPYLLTEYAPAVTQAIEGIERIAGIVSAMKEFSHPGNCQAVAVDINHGLRTTLTVARNEWKYVAEVQADLAADLPHVSGFPGELNQVFLNLIVNAAQAIGLVRGPFPEQKGMIGIRTLAGGGNVVIEVADDGPGIPAEVRPRVFDPFFTTKAVGQGTGQGLAVVHRVVQKHGGRIEVESEVGRGATFRVILPTGSER